MSESAKPPVSARHKKACTECRQQKAKCDAYMNPDAPCSRCRKVGANCVISDPFKREHKRKRLSQLEREAEELRKRLDGNDPRKHTTAPIGILSAASELSITPRSLDPSTPATSPLQSADPLATQSVTINARPAPVVLPSTAPIDSGGATQARSLKVVYVEANEIDEIFQLFFQDYAPFLPILDPNMSPNGYYDQSTLLFWTVIFSASRTYNRNPTLFPTLAEPVMETILLSMGNNAAPIFKIQTFLLYLTWPSPGLEVFFPLSGWLLHLAMQNGLHLPMASHEFGRNGLKSKLEPLQAPRGIHIMDMQRRSELWGHCIVVYQRTCLLKGQPPRAMLDLVPESGHNLCRQLSPLLALQLRCMDIVSKCSVAIFATGVRNTSAEHERSMCIIIRAHEGQLHDLISNLPPNHNTLYPTIARLQIQIFYLYKDLTGPHDSCFTRLTNTACSVIDHINALYGQPEMYQGSASFITNALILACSCLLRLLKSSMVNSIDGEKAKKGFFNGINTIKQTIVGSRDVSTKAVAALNQLWNSSRAFRKSDGSEYSTLRIRSRLVMSPVIDMLWWREEFETDDIGLAEEAENNVNKRDADASLAGPSDIANASSEFQFLNDEFFTDFEWALGNDYLLPAEVYRDDAWPTSRNGELNLPQV